MAARATGLLQRHERGQRDALTVLCYHRVLPQPARAAYHDADLVVTPEAFGQHCAFLAAHFKVLPLGEAMARWQKGERFPRPLLSITFDDGYRDNAVYALPVLRAHGLRATFFVIAGLVDSRELPWYDTAGAALQQLGVAGVKQEIARAKQLAPAERAQWVEKLREEAGLLQEHAENGIMSSAELRAIAAAEHEIGAHSLTHPILTQCDDRALEEETLHARDLLRSITGQEVAGFCYPNGDHDARVVAALQRAGYGYGGSMVPGLNQRDAFAPFTIRRFFVQQERLCGLGAKASPLAMRMEWSGAADALYCRQGASA